MFDTVATQEPKIARKRMLNREQALEAVLFFHGLFDGTTEAGLAAGSVRRGKPFVNDVEYVVRPKMGSATAQDGLFEVPVEVDLFDQRLSGLIEAGNVVRYDLIELEGGGTRAAPWGQFWKKLDVGGIPFDIFIVPEAEKWGRQLVTRTGPWEFSKALVTSRMDGGFKPMGVECRDGGVYTSGGELIPTPSERDYFDVLEVPWIEPEERDQWREILNRRAA